MAAEHPRALNEVRRSLELRPDWEMAAVLQARVLANTSPAGSIDYLSGYLERNPQAQEARLLLARLFLGEKRYDEARKQFDRLLKASPDNPEVVFPVAMLALQFKDLEQAEAALQRRTSTAA